MVETIGQRIALDQKLQVLTFKQQYDSPDLWGGYWPVYKRERLLDFKKTRAFKEVCDQFGSYMSEPLAETEREEITHEFAGALFQAVAFRNLTRRLPIGWVLLSPEKTLEFYKHIYPEARLIEDRFGLDSLDGITVPDGMMLNEERKLIHVVDYTVSRTMVSHKNKLFGLEMDKEREPGIFGGASLLMITPTFENRPADINPGELHFSHKQFGWFVDDVISGLQRAPFSIV